MKQSNIIIKTYAKFFYDCEGFVFIFYDDAVFTQSWNRHDICNTKYDYLIIKMHQDCTRNQMAHLHLKLGT